MKTRVALAVLAIMISTIPAHVFADEGLLEGIRSFMESGTSEELQYDFDIARLNDLKLLGGHIERYKENTGRYPFEGVSELPNYIHIATKEQREYIQGEPPYPHENTDVKLLIAELQRVLGEDIQIPFDPQRVPVNKPNFYIYLVVEDTYFLAAHLFGEYGFANKVANYYYKLELTNASQRGPGKWTLQELAENDEFISAAGRKPNKPGYVESLREKLGGASAF